MVNRRTVLGGFAGLGAVPISSVLGISDSLAVSEPLGLGAIAKRAGVLFGASISEEVWSDPAYQALYLSEVALVTTDRAMKFDHVRPTPKGYEFDRPDRIVRFGEAHNIPVRGHTLIWNDNQPDWINRASNAERRRVFDEWIDVMATRYRGRLNSWDVVNEPFWPGYGEPGGFRTGPWYSAFGTDYISRAFQRTHAIDPTTPLVLNEAQTEREDRLGKTVRAGLLKLVDDLQDKGVRLNAVGLQGHLKSKHVYNSKSFSDFLWALSERKVDIYITELDVNDEAYAWSIGRRDAQTAQLYRRFLDDVLSVPAVKAIVTWQLSDRYSWYRGDWYLSGRPDLDRSRPMRPLLFDVDMKRKAAWHEAAAAFRSRKNLLARKRR